MNEHIREEPRVCLDPSESSEQTTLTGHWHLSVRHGESKGTSAEGKLAMTSGSY